MPDLAYGLKTRQGVGYLTCNLLDKLDFLLHGFGTRQAGMSQAMGIDGQQVFSVNQLHGNGVLVVDEQLVAKWRREQLKRPICTPKSEILGAPISADALLTNQPGVALAVLTADCLPIIIVDPQNRAIAIVHAGWRGTCQGVTQQAISSLVKYSGGLPVKYIIGMGPCIGSCCYEVGAEVVDLFRRGFSDWQAYCVPDKDKWRLDLIAANRCQLLRLGVRPENIGQISCCTACHPEYFFSHRKTPGVSGRMMSLVMLKG